MVPFTARAKKALELSLREAINLSQRDLRAEHLVLGLLREGDGVAARILTERGVTHAAARERIARRDAA
jgi:ATP-dependent Clp protease ATP-binding subunit ClpA